ncbi:MAG TPA: hypothetical protein VJI52_06630 [Candidatus Nanoarchaeia archaeon]|nr:hypothetical protein [Candidatus Nanoarchaeia archaeon]
MGANNSRLFVLLLSVAAALGIGNIWLYPYYSFNYTGLFFIPYFIALIVLGIPLLMLEFSIGQYFSKNVVDLFASIRKWFSGIGWLMLFNAFIVMSFSAVILSWHIIYFFVSFGLQWKNDAKSYFLGNVVQAADGFKNFTQFSLPVFIALVFAWIIVFFCIRNGFEGMKRAFLLILPAFAFLLLLFLAYSLQLDNALNGVYSFLKPDFRGLLDLDVWIAAFSLAIVSLGLSFGIMPAFARKSKGFIAANSSIAVIFELLASLLIGFILFGILGFLEMKNNVNLDGLIFSDYSSFFTTLTQALPFFYKPTLLSLLFFALFTIFFIFGASSLAYSISHVLVHKFNTKHRNAAVFVAGFGFLFGLLFIIKPGFYIMEIVSHFVIYSILIAVLLEVLAVGWFFESEKISAFINQNSALKIGKLWRFIIKYAVPPIVVLLAFFQLKADYLLNYNNYPLWAILVFGLGTIAVPLVIAFFMPRRILDRR